MCKKIQIVVATNNEHKLNEIRSIFKNENIEFLSLKSLNIEIDPNENGLTYKDNALIKAKAVLPYTDLPIMADDSGIEIEKLGEHFPGIHTARFAQKMGGQNLTNEYLVKNTANSNAKFVCHIVLLNFEKSAELHFEGIFKGKINDKVEGDFGFGYDPIFVPDGYEVSVAVLPEEIKNSMSHRYKALKQMYDYIKKVI